MLGADAAVRNRLAEIAHAADDGRTDDYIDMFTEDAVWQVPSGTYVGRQQIHEVLAAIAPTSAQRHVVVNTVMREHDDHIATISDFVFLTHAEIGWTVAAVGRYHDEFVAQDGVWKLNRRVVRDQVPAAYMPAR
ncbi:nuclear transport factor 2 family protein [Phycicoccus sp. Soil802]|uniref:nuclear transport factor 2 family protein n=1 Tax=Phycicoccus sp. Soil802 TaxID=1736414 RepID=UPI0007033DF5|nr:nuclear transport factor 2 family protein [Phycicoccus sp. Soil802]KRF22404.1 hypothetical protein ASG91_19050 [Phycicoccus sp. Soil802]